MTRRETYRARPRASARRSSGSAGTGAGGRDSEAIPDRARRDAGRRGRRGVGGGGRVLALEPGRGAVDTHGLRAKKHVHLSSRSQRRWRTHLAGITLTRVKRAIRVISGHVPVTTHRVVNVLAQSGGVRTVFADTDAELGSRDEVLRTHDKIGRQ